ncbi:MAG: rod shape-determining protein [Lachnospiraceae bacterium]|nr:rod shape-determining protein [Lachnospiraceae bacterium]
MANAYGIDMGTGNLKIYSVPDKKIINVKNTIAIVDKDKMYAYGDEAYSMYEKAPESIQVSFPVVSGVISEFDNMQTMLLEVLEKKAKANMRGADICIAVPTDITEVEKKAFYDLCAKTKNRARSIKLCEKPLADAMGMDLDINEPTGIMVVDIGADTTEISVISLGGMVLSELLPFGGNHLDESIVTYMKRKYNLLIGQKTAMSLKENIGGAYPGNTESMEIVGRDVVSGLPIEMKVTGDMVYEGMKSDLNNLCQNVKMLLEKVPPELAKDVVYSGIYLTGGGAKLKELSDYFTEITNIKVNVYENGEETVVKGLGKVLTDDHYSRFGYAMKSRIFS